MTIECKEHPACIDAYGHRYRYATHLDNGAGKPACGQRMGQRKVSSEPVEVNCHRCLLPRTIDKPVRRPRRFSRPSNKRCNYLFPTKDLPGWTERVDLLFGNQARCSAIYPHHHCLDCGFPISDRDFPDRKYCGGCAYWNEEE